MSGPWIDIHSHILPGIDDGAASDEEMLAMAEVAAAGGSSIVVATPHVDHEGGRFDYRIIAPEVARCNALISERGIPVELIPGVEVRINAGMSGLLAETSAEVLTLGGTGRYLLADIPMLEAPLGMQELLFEAQLKGLTPIIAHPERCRPFVEDPGLLSELADRGMEIQIDSDSLEGRFGRDAHRLGWALLREGTARLVASDAHSATVRNPDLSKVAESLDKRLGDGSAQLLLYENPRRVLAGEGLLELPAAGERKAGGSAGGKPGAGVPAAGRRWRNPFRGRAR